MAGEAEQKVSGDGTTAGAAAGQDAGTGNATGAQGQGAAGAATGTAPNGGEQSVTFNEQQQAAIDRLIGERLKRARTTWEEEAKAKAVKTAEDAEAERLKAQQQFKELSEKQAAKLSELEGLKPELERYKAALAAYAQKAREGVPASVLPLLEKLDAVEQLAYLAEHGAELTAGQAQGAAKAATVPATPGATKATAPDEAERRKKAASIRRIW